MHANIVISKYACSFYDFMECEFCNKIMCCQDCCNDQERLICFYCKAKSCDDYKKYNYCSKWHKSSKMS